MNSKVKSALLYQFFRPQVKFICNFFLRLKYYNKENVPKEGPFILAGTHTHNLDCFVVMSSTKKTIHFLAKKELTKGIKKIIFNNMAIIPVDRKVHDSSSLNEAKRVLNEGKIIAIFPEGTTEKEKGVLLPFKIGAVKMAHDTKIPIIPFVISGDYKLFSKNLKIIYGEKMDIKSDDLEKENERLKNEIIKLKEKANELI